MSITDPHSGKVRFSVVPAAYVYLLRGGEIGAPGGAGVEVLLQLRQNTGFMDDHWAAAAAGHIERWETAAEAIAREAAEEIGVHDVVLDFATSMQRTQRGLEIDERVDFFFTARSWRGEPRIMEGAKCADLRWFALDDLPEAVVPHERFVLDGLRDATLAPLTAHGF
ncbi:NUDIX domain-containing protein [Nocardioides sp.]|uniref:NUDIX domain-containing protein n=1 Tax=Nocardioides sp. TaxID=35761 RepID=UPI003516EFDF